MGVLGLWSEAGHGQGGEGVALIIPRFLLVLLSEAAFLCIFYHVTILYQVFAPESSPYLLWVSLLLQLFTLVPPPPTFAYFQQQGPYHLFWEIFKDLGNLSGRLCSFRK